MAYDGYGYYGYGYGSYGGYGYGYSTYGYDYGGYNSYSYYGPPYGHGNPNGYGIGYPRTAGLFEADLQPGQNESFTHQSGYVTSTVYAVRNVDGTSYAYYSTYNDSSGLNHTDTVYARVTSYSGYDYTTYYAHHYDGYTFSEQASSYNYRPGNGYPSYLADHEYKQYAYSDGSSLDIADYFRSDSTHSDTDPTTTTYHSEAQTTTDAYGYSTYSLESSSQSLNF